MGEVNRDVLGRFGVKFGRSQGCGRHHLESKGTFRHNFKPVQVLDTKEVEP